MSIILILRPDVFYTRFPALIAFVPHVVFAPITAFATASPFALGTPRLQPNDAVVFSVSHVFRHITAARERLIQILGAQKISNRGLSRSEGDCDGVLLRGKRLEVAADVDAAGLATLQEILTIYAGILKLVEPK